MHGDISYKNEILWRGNSTEFNELAEKLLTLAQNKFIDPDSTVVHFIEGLGYNTGGSINTDLNSKKEVKQFSELLELAIQEWRQEGYYDYYNYEENGEIKNAVLNEHIYFAKIVREIADHEWTDENLFIGRIDKIYNLAPLLLRFARKKNIDSKSHLMSFLKKLNNREAVDIEIFSKDELVQCIELAELSVNKLTQQGYFKKNNTIKNDIFLNYGQYRHIVYINCLKELAMNWDSAISDEWKQGKLLSKREPVIHKSSSYMHRIIYIAIAIASFGVVIIGMLGIGWMLEFIKNISLLAIT